MPSGTLRELWEMELQDLYSAEQRILTALPELIAKTTSSDLRNALDDHLRRTRIHVERLDLIFKQSGITKSSTQQTSGIDGIIRTGSERLSKNGVSDVRDAAIIAAAQHVEHYEMAGYGCARTWARQLGDDVAADLLQQTLDEEGEADKALTDLAQSGINQAASAGTNVQRPQPRLRYVDVDDLPESAGDYDEATVRNRQGDDLGSVDGFVVDTSGRPYYLVVDSGGVFVGRRYVVPIGRASFGRGDRLFTIDLDKDTLKRYPEFHRDAFIAMNDEEARRYEWRVLEAIDPNAARSSTRTWDYDRFPYYRQPDWFESDWATSTRHIGRAETGATRSREVPIVEREDRERVVAREERPAGESVRDRERIRGRNSDDDIR